MSADPKYVYPECEPTCVNCGCFGCGCFGPVEDCDPCVPADQMVAAQPMTAPTELKYTLHFTELHDYKEQIADQREPAESANPQKWAYDALNALVSLKRDLESRSSAVLDKASGRDPELANLISQMRETQIASVSNAIDYLRTRLDIK